MKIDLRAEYFNDFFSNILVKIKSQIAETNVPHHNVQRNFTWKHQLIKTVNWQMFQQKNFYAKCTNIAEAIPIYKNGEKTEQIYV